MGFGSLGKYIARAIVCDPKVSKKYQLVFVWNRSASAFTETLDFDFDPSLILEDLNDFASRSPSLIVEVAHPSITQLYGEKFIEFSDYFVGSPTSFANPETEHRIRAAAERAHGITFSFLNPSFILCDYSSPSLSPLS